MKLTNVRMNTEWIESRIMRLPALVMLVFRGFEVARSRDPGCSRSSGNALFRPLVRKRWLSHDDHARTTLQCCDHDVMTRVRRARSTKGSRYGPRCSNACHISP